MTEGGLNSGPNIKHDGNSSMVRLISSPLSIARCYEMLSSPRPTNNRAFRSRSRFEMQSTSKQRIVAIFVFIVSGYQWMFSIVYTFDLDHKLRAIASYLVNVYLWRCYILIVLLTPHIQWASRFRQRLYGCVKDCYCFHEWEQDLWLLRSYRKT